MKRVVAMGPFDSYIDCTRQNILRRFPEASLLAVVLLLIRGYLINAVEVYFPRLTIQQQFTHFF